MAAVAVTTLVVDQVTKEWALSALGGGRVRHLIGDWITLRLLHNPGAAFSVGDTNTVLTTAIAVLVTVAVLYWSRRVGNVAWALVLGLIIGGSLGNLVDRFAREPGPGRGHVVDFIDYFGVFVGNIADIAIVGAALGVAVLTFWGIQLDGSREDQAGGEVREAPSGLRDNGRDD